MIRFLFDRQVRSEGFQSLSKYSSYRCRIAGKIEIVIYSSLWHSNLNLCDFHISCMAINNLNPSALFLSSLGIQFSINVRKNMLHILSDMTSEGSRKNLVTR